MSILLEHMIEILVNYEMNEKVYYHILMITDFLDCTMCPGEI